MHILKKNLEFLCRTIEGVVREDGTINAKRAAEVLDLQPTTLFRILRGESGQVRPVNERKILNYFGITKDQLYSNDIEAAINTDNVQRILNEINNLPDIDRVKIKEAVIKSVSITPVKLD